MRQYLVTHGTQELWIRTPVAETFDTDGEMASLVRDLRERSMSPEDTFTIYLVARWWHLPRACLLLRARLRKSFLDKRTQIRAVPVWTFHDPMGMLREPFAWVKNVQNFKGA